MADAHSTDKLFGDKHIPLGQMFKRILVYLKPEWHRFLLSFVLIIATVGFDIVLPLFIKDFHSKVINNILSCPLKNHTFKV